MAEEYPAPESVGRFQTRALGVGAIALALASELPQADVCACDISDEALEMARVNAARSVRPGPRETGFCLTRAGRERTFSGHQNQRPSSAATDGIMNDRTTSVSNRSPKPIVVPT